MRPDMTHWELARHFANKDAQVGGISQLLELMSERISPSDLANQHSASREAVHEITEPLEPWAVERFLNGERKITTAGEVARRAYKEAVDIIDSDDIAWLSWSENRGRILNGLRSNGPISSRDLTEFENMPGKRTIRRNFDEFEKNGWVVCEGHEEVAQLTIEGEKISRTYENLLGKMEQVIEKAPCLRDLGLACADIPIEALSDAEIVEATPRHPHNIHGRVRAMADIDFQHARSFQSYWNAETAKAFEPAVKAGKRFEVISPPIGIDDLPKRTGEVKSVIGGLAADNYQWAMYPGKLPCALLILDDTHMTVGPPTPGDANKTRTGCLFTRNEELINWAMDLYEEHHQEANDPFDISSGFSISVEDLISLLRKRYLSDDADNTRDVTAE